MSSTSLQTIETKQQSKDEENVSFGLLPINTQMIDQLCEKHTNHVARLFLRRGLFNKHKDLELILADLENGRPIYIYTGRGPTSSSMHLGHLIPFLFTQYLQDKYKAKVVIQITDDEKMLFRGCTYEEVCKNAKENIKDIIACGFDPKLTFIFQNTNYIRELYPNILRIQTKITNSQSFKTFGICPVNNIGQTSFCAIQAAPSFACSFPTFLEPNCRCLIPCGEDQDPYFRLTRDVAPKLFLLKPSLICSSFIPSLNGVGEKMSSSDPKSAIFLSDTDQQIREKITQSFSGGGNTKKEQLENGANLTVDVAFQLLKIFLNKDDELETITQYYGPNPEYKPKLTSFFVKQKAIEVVTRLIRDLQRKRESITEDYYNQFVDIVK